MSEVDDYLGTVPAAQAAEFSRLRRLIHAAAPGATEGKSYGMPAFRYRGKYLAAFYAFKDHLSLFPGPSPIAALQDRLTDFRTAKGTVQFTPEHPLPDELVVALIGHRVGEIEAAGTARRSAAAAPRTAS